MGYSQRVGYGPPVSPPRFLFPGSRAEWRAARLPVLGGFSECPSEGAGSHRMGAGRPARGMDVSLPHPGAPRGRHDGTLRRRARLTKTRRPNCFSRRPFAGSTSLASAAIISDMKRTIALISMLLMAHLSLVGNDWACSKHGSATASPAHRAHSAPSNQADRA